ncbi:MAG: right-handed parallel beta-helix repeat-containing protein, partial [Candidatus Altarchaeum sp.]|nr:right-handed parallel beta-helix repeat-containing protein [Candidatus Altarchaeum sp.]
IKNCIIKNFSNVVYLYSSLNSVIVNNTLNLNAKGGIHFDSCTNNTIANNMASSNSISGIMLDSSSNNTLFNNSVNSNYFGVFLVGDTANNTLNSNTLCNNRKYDIFSGSLNYATGDNNTCVTTKNYKDNESVACNNTCPIDSCNCSSCGECSYKLSHPSCEQVNLTADVMNLSGTCIEDPVNFNNKIFDCKGYTIIERNDFEGSEFI